MANPTEVTSPAAPAAPAALEQSGADRKKGNVSGASAERMLTKSFLQRAESAAKPNAPGDRTSSIAAGTPESPTGPEGTANTPATPEKTPQVGAPPETAEAKPKPGAEPKEDTPEVLSNFSHLDSKTREIVEAELKRYKESNQSNVDKRIGKEVAKRKALEEELGRWQAQAPVRSPLETPAPVAPVASPPPAQVPTDSPLAHINDLASLDREFHTIKELRREAEDALSAGPDDQGRYQLAGRELTKEQVLNLRRNTTVALEDHIPQRMNFIQTRANNQSKAAEDFPWLKNPASAEFQQAAAIAAQYPFVRNLPNAENILGVMVEGLLAVEARKAALGKALDKPAARSTRAPSDQTVFSGTATAASRQSEGAYGHQALSDEREKLEKKKGVSGRDMTRFLLASDQLRNSR